MPLQSKMRPRDRTKGVNASVATNRSPVRRAAAQANSVRLRGLTENMMLSHARPGAGHQPKDDFLMKQTEHLVKRVPTPARNAAALRLHQQRHQRDAAADDGQEAQHDRLHRNPHRVAQAAAGTQLPCRPNGTRLASCTVAIGPRSTSVASNTARSLRFSAGPPHRRQQPAVALRRVGRARHEHRLGRGIAARQLVEPALAGRVVEVGDAVERAAGRRTRSRRRTSCAG